MDTVSDASSMVERVIQNFWSMHFKGSNRQKDVDCGSIDGALQRNLLIAICR
jgi:hypothetical protein